MPERFRYRFAWLSAALHAAFLALFLEVVFIEPQPMPTPSSPRPVALLYTSSPLGEQTRVEQASADPTSTEQTDRAPTQQAPSDPTPTEASSRARDRPLAAHEPNDLPPAPSDRSSPSPTEPAPAKVSDQPVDDDPPQGLAVRQTPVPPHEAEYVLVDRSGLGQTLTTREALPSTPRTAPDNPWAKRLADVSDSQRSPSAPQLPAQQQTLEAQARRFRAAALPALRVALAGQRAWAASQAMQDRERVVEEIQRKVREVVPLVFTDPARPDEVVERVLVRVQLGPSGYITHMEMVSTPNPFFSQLTHDILHLAEPFIFTPGWVEVTVEFKG